MVLYIFTGVAGVGKSTTINIAIKGTRIKHVNYGDVVLKLAKRQKLVKNRDEIRKIKWEKYKVIQEKAARKIAKIKGDIILNTHCSLKTPTGYFPGLPLNVLRMLKPKTIILLEANPKDVLKQRKKDIGKRERSDWGGTKETEEHQMINRCYAAAYSFFTNANVVIIKNIFGRPEKAAKKLREVLI